MIMKRAVTFGLFGLGVAVLGGRPIYPSDRDHRVCIGGDCYDCTDSYYSDACRPWSCNSPADCPSRHTCPAERRCKLDMASPGGGGSSARPSDCASGNFGA